MIYLGFVCFDFDKISIVLTDEESKVTSAPVIISNEDGQVHETISVMPPTIDRSQEDDESENIDR